MPIDSMSLENYYELAQIIFPDIKETPAEIKDKYPPRSNPAGSWIGRFAPSPTGFIHIGGIFAALVNRMAAQKGGTFILRIEDTDQKREIDRGIEMIIDALAQLNLLPDEGPYTTDPIQERGAYGPYIQSNRVPYYKVFAKDLIARGKAYPCFMESEELDAIREEQMSRKIAPGIYGNWAHSRSLTIDEVKKRVENGDKYVIRLRSEGKDGEKVQIDDRIRGLLEFPANIIDSVLLKSDRYPTYHFAHVVDELLMHVNLVLRGDEWLSSVPLHVQLHEAIQAPLPQYAHFGPIAKMEGSSRRKLSKRKDPEAAMSYYYEKGYPSQAVIEYLLNLANSSFEEWRLKEPKADYRDFPFDIEQLGKTSMLFDMDKLVNISKNYIAEFSAQEVFDRIVAWAGEYRPELSSILTADPEYSCKILNIGRTGEAPRKDLAKWEDIDEYFGFFFDPLFEQSVREGYAGMPALKSEDIFELLNFFLETLPMFDQEDKVSWLNRMRQFAAENGYAAKRKECEKAPPGQFKGWFGDIMMVLRVALCGRTFAPDTYEMIQVMGTARAEKRFIRARDYFQNQA